MRWTEPELGRERTRLKLLFFPRQFGKEKRWLEFARIVERFEAVPTYYPGCLGAFMSCEWREIGFADSEFRLEALPEIPVSGYQPIRKQNASRSKEESNEEVT